MSFEILMIGALMQVSGLGLVWGTAVLGALEIALPLLVIWYIYTKFQDMIRKTIQEEFRKLKEEQTRSTGSS